MCFLDVYKIRWAPRVITRHSSPFHMCFVRWNGNKQNRLHQSPGYRVFCDTFYMYVQREAQQCINMCSYFVGGASPAAQLLHPQPSSMRTSTRVDVHGKVLNFRATVQLKFFSCKSFHCFCELVCSCKINNCKTTCATYISVWFMLHALATGLAIYLPVSPGSTFSRFSQSALCKPLV